MLAGGISHEREVSLHSGRRLAAALRGVGVDVREWDVDGALVERLRADPPDAVAIALHGGEGENGSVQAVLELLGVPFVGTPARACRRAWDKPTAKAELARAGLDTPDWIALPHTTFRALGAQAVLDAMVDRLGLPLMLKPDQGGSALGAQVVSNRAELPAAMVSCLAYADTVLAEQFVDGVEVAVTVVEDEGVPRALPAVEVEAKGGVYDYTARYTPGAAHFHCPARSTPRLPPRWPTPRWPRTNSSGSATSPAPTPWSTPRAGADPGGQRLPGPHRHLAAPHRGRGRRPRPGPPLRAPRRPRHRPLFHVKHRP